MKAEPIQTQPSAAPLPAQLEILLPTAVAHGFDYVTPEGMALREGDIVTVPFGRSETLGVVWGAGQAQLPAARLKPVAAHLAQFPPLSASMRQFIDWTAWYNCAPKGAILKMALPIADIAKEGRKGTEPPPPPAGLAGLNLAPLSGLQREAADTLKHKIGQGFSVSVIDGVTGSGKTEVYFDTIAHALQADPGRQVLVMLPEIALSVQWLERFAARFGFAPTVWNSEITPARKRAAWQAIARGDARVVIGARSALFLPYRQLALIIADEEHDNSYKQEEGVVYHARDMAVARARFENIPVMLVSATPSLESYYNMRQGKYAGVSLPARHGEAVMPDISLIDMRHAATERGCFISAPLREAVAQAMGRGHQSLLFLNRRGFAPLLLCRTCGHRFQCPQCSAWLVLHRSRPRLECHHCGHREAAPSACPACAAPDQLHACGPGVERLHEEVQAFLPQARVAVMASDSAASYADISETIAAMTERRIDVLIGTQMIAKGHHFAGLAVVGVVDADLGLAGGDLRAAEHTYQLLHQLSGRAGREQVRGTVYLQSFLPSHPVMQALVAGSRDAFMAAELQARRNASMPPFSRLAALIIDGAGEEQVLRAANALAAQAVPSPKLHILGPAPAPLYMLRGKYRYRLLVKAERAVNLPDYMRAWVDAVKLPSQVRVRIDIDPVSFL